MGVPPHFRFGCEPCEYFGLVQIVKEGGDIGVDGVEAIIEDKRWVVEGGSDAVVGSWAWEGGVGRGMRGDVGGYVCPVVGVC